MFWPFDALLLDGAGDGLDFLQRLLGAGIDLLQRISRLASQVGAGTRLGAALLDAVDGRLRLALNGADHGADLTGGSRRALGELAHLVGDDSKAAALFARTRRLDGGVEGQQIGLVGNVVNRAHNP